MSETKHAGLTVEKVAFAQTEPHPSNPRIHPPDGSPEYDRLKASLADEYFDPLVWNKRNGMMVSGHFRRTILMAEGFASADMVVVDWPEGKHKARMIAANELLGTFDDAKLAELLQDEGIDRMLTGLTDNRIDDVLARLVQDEHGQKPSGTLAERFGVPPFSVLDARQGYWQDRKRAWVGLGIRSEIGRGSTPSKSVRAAPGETPTYRQIASPRSQSNAAIVSQGAMRKFQATKTKKATAGMEGN
jgi:hypothetical protein